jgi:putative AlgH/UPF0301 family transcriptional regulator
LLTRIRDALEQGKKPTKSRYVRISMATSKDILNRLQAGESPQTISLAVGCSVSTVKRLSLGEAK